MRDLVRDAFTMTNKLGTIAYQLFEKTGDTDVFFTPIIAGKLMQQIAPRVFGGEPSHVLVSRLAKVSLLVAKRSKEGCLEVAPYIREFVRYIEEPDVIDMFRDLLSGGEVSEFLQGSIAQCGFIETLVQACRTMECKTQYDGNSLYCYGVLKLIELCGGSSVLGPVVKRPDIVQNFFKPQPMAPNLVKAARWKAFLSLITPENTASFGPLLNEAASELGIGPTLPEHQLEIIRFLMLISNESPTISTQLVQMNMVSVLSAMLKRFPNHTICHRYVKKCLLHCMSNKVLGPHLWTLLREMADLIPDRSQGNFILSASCIGFFITLMDMAKENETIRAIVPHFVPMSHPCWATVNRAKQISLQDYGGPLPQ